MPVEPGKDRIARARAMLGASFRLHGRDPAFGIDCVGLIALVINRPAPTGYALRGGSAGGWAAMLDGVMQRRRRAIIPGDILLFEAGPLQFHLGVWTGESLIHADAGLRRVVETPGMPPWAKIGAWGRAKGI